MSSHRESSAHLKPITIKIETKRPSCIPKPIIRYVELIISQAKYFQNKEDS